MTLNELSEKGNINVTNGSIIFSFEDLKNLIQETVQKTISQTLQKKELEKIYSKKEAAEYLNVSQPTIDRWKKQKRINYSKIGGKVTFTETDLIEALQKK
jgi:excisionase family DNA binding protein